MSLDDARSRVMTSYDQGILSGQSMSPIWLEEWETSRIAAQWRVVVVELHSASTSNRGRSHIQVILPAPEHVPGLDDKVIWPSPPAPQVPDSCDHSGYLPSTNPVSLSPLVAEWAHDDALGRPP